MFLYLFSLFIILLFVHIICNYNERARMIKKIPGPKDAFIVGNGLTVIRSAVEIMKMGRTLASTFDGIYRLWIFPYGAVVIYNPDDIQTVMSSSYCNDKSLVYRILKPWLGDGLLVSNGAKWQERRKILTPAFHFNILKQFGEIIEENSHRLVEKLKQNVGKPIDIVPILSEFTLNSICETSMGTQLDKNTSIINSYKNAIYSLGWIFLQRFVRIYLYLDFLYNLTSLARDQKKNLKIVHNFTKKVIEQRREYIEKNGINIAEQIEADDDTYVYKKSKKTAMLDLLLSAEKEGLIDEAGIQEEVDTFMFEGHDTTASGLTFAFMMLANHRKIQDKIRDELNEIFGDSKRPIKMADFPKMKYMECCIKESMRLYPPVHFISRNINETIVLSSYTIPPGTHCHIPILDLHHREDLFKDPQVFDPDRFLPENSVGRHPFSYIPFSAGARNCIGQKFAMMEMKIAIAQVLRDFVLVPVTRPSDIIFSGDLVLRNDGPVLVQFIKRELTRLGALVYCFGILIFLCVVHILFNYNARARSIKKIPGPEDDFIFGNALRILRGPVEIMKMRREFARKWRGIYRVWIFPFAAVVIYNPQDIEVIMSSMKYTEKSLIYKVLRPWLQDGLLLSNGAKWQERRKILTPAFHFKVLRQFSIIMAENTQRMLGKLKESEGKPIDIVPVISEFTLNAICETAMGTQLSDTNGKVISYKQAINDLGKNFFERVFRVYLFHDFVFNLTSSGRKQNRQIKTVRHFTETVIKQRKEFLMKHEMNAPEQISIENDDLKKKKKKTVMLDLLISAEKEGLIDKAGIQEEVDTFMFEGHDTTASGLTFFFMLLANHKDIQDKIVDELDNIFGDSDRCVCMDDLPKMKYLECCIKESLRLYPPVHFISRQLEGTTVLSNYTTPAGTLCHISVYDLHRCSTLYEDPEMFDPDRFLPENSEGRHPYAFIPFSAGPRNCIGQRFAMMEMKITVAEVLREYELKPVTRTEDIELIPDMVLRNNGPVHVTFVKRER